MTELNISSTIDLCQKPTIRFDPFWNLVEFNNACSEVCFFLFVLESER